MRRSAASVYVYARRKSKEKRVHLYILEINCNDDEDDDGSNGDDCDYYKCTSAWGISPINIKSFGIIVRFFVSLPSAACRFSFSFDSALMFFNSVLFKCMVDVVCVCVFWVCECDWNECFYYTTLQPKMDGALSKFSRLIWVQSIGICRRSNREKYLANGGFRGKSNESIGIDFFLFLWKNEFWLLTQPLNTFSLFFRFKSCFKLYHQTIQTSFLYIIIII